MQHDQFVATREDAGDGADAGELQLVATLVDAELIHPPSLRRREPVAVQKTHHERGAGDDREDELEPRHAGVGRHVPVRGREQRNDESRPRHAREDDGLSQVRPVRQREVLQDRIIFPGVRDEGRGAFPGQAPGVERVGRRVELVSRRRRTEAPVELRRRLDPRVVDSSVRAALRREEERPPVGELALVAPDASVVLNMSLKR